MLQLDKAPKHAIDFTLISSSGWHQLKSRA